MDNSATFKNAASAHWQVFGGSGPDHDQRQHFRFLYVCCEGPAVFFLQSHIMSLLHLMAHLAIEFAHDRSISIGPQASPVMLLISFHNGHEEASVDVLHVFNAETCAAICRIRRKSSLDCCAVLSSVLGQ